MGCAYVERGDSSALCLVKFHGNGSMIQDLVISGLVDQLGDLLAAVLHGVFPRRPVARWSRQGSVLLP